jgi:hypothetical protein
MTTRHLPGRAVRALIGSATSRREVRSARYKGDVERGRRNVGLVNVGRLARALSVDLQTFMAGVEEERDR